MVEFVFAAEPEKTIVLGVTAPALKSSQVQFAKKIYSDIFEDLSYKMKIEVLPSIRLAMQTKSGAIDGELIRMSGYGKTQQHLTRVEEPVFEFVVAIYSNDKHLNVVSLGDFKGLSVGYRRGVKVVENELIEILNEDGLAQFTDIRRALRMLSMKRLDAYVGIESLTDEYLVKQPEKTVSNVFKVLKLKEDSAHLFLGEKFSFLATKISMALKQMKRSGRYDEIKKQTKE
jgi:ABC-type amino acid transport substrate-binding protein